MGLETILAAIAAGAAIGLVLALVGGGGSILAVPLLVYLVGVDSPHAAIGTAAVAVALNAASSLAGHARSGNVKWPCALTFAGAGVIGAALGAEAGKAMDGARLLALFGGLMVLVGLSMLRPRKTADNPDVRLERSTASVLLPRLVPTGLGVGALAGFFGIGGGFLIVPGLVMATRMPLRIAVGTSLVVVTALGLTTATSYALSGYVDWGLVGLMVIGGLIGAGIGIPVGKRLANRKRAMELGFAALVIVIGLYVIVRGLT
ncbi:MAG: sulfite exporter TauE/SafE family protein [Sphingomonadaceae bacterium]|nr:sulfite exporter TauE/SafE family protein [Sphingomonadaceae bacterium]